jgi:hypothetical protein
MDTAQEQFERAVADEFFEWFNAQRKTSYSYSRRGGEAPDLVYSWDGEELFVEITAGYYDNAHGAFLSKSARGASDAPAGWVGANPDKSLAQAIARRVNDKCSKRYGPRTLLLVNVPPGVTSAEKLSELLVQERFPDPMPFAGAYVCGRFPITTSSSGGYRILPIRDLPANPTPNTDARKSGARRLA